MRVLEPRPIAVRSPAPRQVHHHPVNRRSDQDHQERGDAVALRLTRSGSTLRIDAAPGGTGPRTVQMVRYTPERTAKITRGENAGHTLRYANVTEDWQVLGTWPGTAPLSMEVAAPGDKPVVVLLQRGTDGPIVAAKQVK